MQSLFSDKKRMKLEGKQYGRRRKISKHLEISQPSIGQRDAQGSRNCTGMN